MHMWKELSIRLYERCTEELQGHSKLYKRSAAGLTGQPASNTLLYHISIKYV